MVTKAVIDTLIAEAGGEGDTGLIAAAWAIQQRAAARGQTIDQVVRSGFDGFANPGPGAQKSQQDPDLRAKVEQIMRGVQSGNIPNPVPGADHFLSGDVMPSWAKQMTLVATVGGHRFYASGKVPASAQGRAVSADDLPAVASELSVNRAVQGFPTPRSQRPAQYEYAPNGRPRDPDNGFLLDKSDPRYREAAAGSPVESVRQSVNTAQVPLPRPRPSMPVVPYEQGQTVATVETAKPQRLPPIVPNGVTYAGQERGPTTAPRQAAVTPTPEQAEAATGFRLPGQSAPPGGSFAGQERGPVTQPRIALFSEVPGPSSPDKSQDRLAATDPVIVPRSGTEQPTRQQVEEGTGFRLGSPLTEEVEIENPAYTALMKRVQQGEIELKGIAPSGMAMSRDARARYDASLKALEAQRQQLAGMSRTTTVTRQVAQKRAPVQQKRAPVVQQQRPVINPANHNQAQLDAVAAGRSGYTSSSGAVLPTHSIGGKLRYTYGD